MTFSQVSRVTGRNSISHLTALEVSEVLIFMYQNMSEVFGNLQQVFNDTTRQVGHPITREALLSGIKAIGAEHCIMSTDSGQWLNPVPAQQMGIYIQDMLNFGFYYAHKFGRFSGCYRD